MSNFAKDELFQSVRQALDVSEKSEEPRFDLQCELEPIKVQSRDCRDLELGSSGARRGVRRFWSRLPAIEAQCEMMRTASLIFR